MECSHEPIDVDITEQQHQSPKALAALQGKTIKQYALERLFPGDADGELAWQELPALMGARISEAQAGKVSARTMSETFWMRS